MPRCIIKIKDKFLVWSTIVDAPVTYALTREELEVYINAEYGRQGLIELPPRLERVEKYGTSFEEPTLLKDLINYNRAGDKETCLSEEEIYSKYTYQS